MYFAGLQPFLPDQHLLIIYKALLDIHSKILAYLD